MADLLNVPLEVLLQITSYLTTPEYGYLRRTCKQLEALLFGAFSREFFSKRQFALIEFSIQALVDIAKSRLGPSLTHLIIHIEHPFSPFSYPTRPPASREMAVRDNRYRAESINHMEFINTGLDVEMLSDAVKHLPNLETIGIRDFYSRNRTRDDTVWHSYGCPTFLKQTKDPLVLPYSSSSSGRDRGPEYTGHIFLTLLRAIGIAKVSGQSSKVTRFEVLLHHSSLPDQAFKIPNRFQAEVSLAMSNLEAIFLDGLSESALDFVVNDIVDTAGTIMGSGYFLSRFLAKLPALQHLRLNFQKYGVPSTERFLLWLANARSDTAHATASPTGSHPSKQLKCKHDTQVNLWARLCDKMAAADLQLHKLELSHLTQTSGDQDERRGTVSFNGSKNAQVKTWRGSAFSQSVKDITDKMDSRWDEERSDVDYDDSMDDDDDDDDDDNE
ncbi:hypothetical protein FHL15_000058 [Xylaria flabelliformis]|uniref:F-box domain-containing protein n=1 Tax=Xylaria flabelliformis TaxID=2512241 RepID=A0A553IEU5_9PEZI|nr:hypothetical protein FHL15_000058 [Xylaria flabelliformis]